MAAIDARNARKAGTKPSGSDDSRAVASSLEAAEKAVNKFVARRLQPAVKKVLYTACFTVACTSDTWSCLCVPFPCLKGQMLARLAGTLDMFWSERWQRCCHPHQCTGICQCRMVLAEMNTSSTRC